MTNDSDKYGTTAIHKQLLSLIDCFNKICISNDVSYSLGFGSMLGAVRHQGFIPWDDDIDILVDRYNYEKLRKLFDRHSDLELTMKSDLWIYRVKFRDSEKDHASIDVFVADESPDSVLLQRVKVFTLRVLQGMMQPGISDVHRYSLINLFKLRITHFMGKAFTYKQKFEMYDDIMKWGNGAKKNNRIGFYNGIFKVIGLQFDNDLLSEIEYLPFENLELPVIKKYDEFLTLNYGDYMIPPAENKRLPIHV